MAANKHQTAPRPLADIHPHWFSHFTLTQQLGWIWTANLSLIDQPTQPPERRPLQQHQLAERKISASAFKLSGGKAHKLMRMMKPSVSSDAALSQRQTFQTDGQVVPTRSPGRPHCSLSLRPAASAGPPSRKKKRGKNAFSQERRSIKCNGWRASCARPRLQSRAATSL